jgi:hypothetical protein
LLDEQHVEVKLPPASGTEQPLVSRDLLPLASMEFLKPHKRRTADNNVNGGIPAVSAKNARIEETPAKNVGPEIWNRERLGTLHRTRIARRRFPYREE